MANKVIVVFELTMPNRGSYNGRWSQENDKHLIFKYYTPKQFESVKDKIIGDFYYRWDDGWTACVSSKVIDGVESRRLHRLNRNFCGYDWMVDSILEYGTIKRPSR